MRQRLARRFFISVLILTVGPAVAVTPCRAEDPGNGGGDAAVHAATAANSWKTGIESILAIGRVDGSINARRIIIPEDILSFPLELAAFSGKITVNDSRLKLTNISASVMGGTITGEMLVNIDRFRAATGNRKNQISLNLQLNNVRLERIRKLAALPFELDGVLNGSLTVRVSGDTLEVVVAHVDIRRFVYSNFQLDRFRATLEFDYTHRRLSIKDMDAEIYNGIMIGSAALVFDPSFKKAEYDAEIWAEDIELEAIERLPEWIRSVRGTVGGRLHVVGDTDAPTEPRRVSGNVSITPFNIETNFIKLDFDEFSTELEYDEASGTFEMRALNSVIYGGDLLGLVKVKLSENAAGKTGLDFLSMALDLKRVEIRNIFKWLKVDINDGIGTGVIYLKYTAKNKRTVMAGSVDIDSFAYGPQLRTKNINGGFVWDSEANVIEFNPIRGKLFDGEFDGSGVLILANKTIHNPPVVKIASPADGATVSGAVRLHGFAGGAASVQSVDCRIGDSPWQETAGLEDWNVILDTTRYPNGPLTITVRVQSGAPGERRSTISAITLHVDNKTASPSGELSHPLTRQSEPLTVDNTVMRDPSLFLTTMARDHVQFRLNGVCRNIDIAQLNSVYGNPRLVVGGRASGILSFRTDRDGMAELLVNLRAVDFRYKKWMIDAMNVEMNYQRALATATVRARNIHVYGGNGDVSIVFDLNSGGRLIGFRDGTVSFRAVSLKALAEQQSWRLKLGGRAWLTLSELKGTLGNDVTLRGIGRFHTEGGALYKLPMISGVFIRGFNSRELRKANAEFQLYGDEIRLTKATVESRDKKTKLFMDTNAGPPGAFDFDGDIRQAFLLNWSRPVHWTEIIPVYGWLSKLRDLTSNLGRLRVSGSFSNPDISNWTFSLRNTLRRNFEKRRAEERKQIQEWKAISERLLLIDAHHDPAGLLITPSGNVVHVEPESDSTPVSAGDSDRR